MFRFLVLFAVIYSVSGQAFTGNDVVFHLFTRTNPVDSQPLLSSAASIMTSNFGIAKKTVFTIHSHGGSAVDNFNAFIIPALLQNGDYNVIAVDWRTGASFYTMGLSNAVAVGEVVAAFLDILSNSFAYDIGSAQIVGFGLGGHIAGIAGRRASGTLGSITALDPSFYGWTHNSEILSPDSATYVEVLHTNAGTNGYDYPLGHVDFYSNGGSAQVPCFTDNQCSHLYSYVYYAESMQAELSESANKFVGTYCETYDEAISHVCNSEDTLVFGGSETKEANGVYYFRTNSVQPFALG